MLYKELYYRHIYAKLTPTLEQRFESFENYCDLFNFILNSDEPVQIELPNPWLWDIIDEFIYQFQVRCRGEGFAAKRVLSIRSFASTVPASRARPTRRSSCSRKTRKTTRKTGTCIACSTSSTRSPRNPTSRPSSRLPRTART